MIPISYNEMMKLTGGERIMGYQPLDPNSAQAMKLIADKCVDTITNKHLEAQLAKIKEAAESGSHMTEVGFLYESDIKQLKKLGYKIKKCWFRDAYRIWWLCD